MTQYGHHIQYGSHLVGHDAPNVDRIPGSSPGHTANNGTPGGGLSGGHEVADVIQSPPLTRTYQRTGQMLIRPLLFEAKHSAFDLCRLFYAQYPDLNFGEDLLDYMRTGFVCSRPNLFVMAKVINYEGEVMWFCRIAIGNLVELLSVIPFYLPRVAFCRNNRATHMRICTIKRLCQLAVRNAKAKGKKWAAAAV